MEAWDLTLGGYRDTVSGVEADVGLAWVGQPVPPCACYYPGGLLLRPLGEVVDCRHRGIMADPKQKSAEGFGFFGFRLSRAYTTRFPIVSILSK